MSGSDGSIASKSDRALRRAPRWTDRVQPLFGTAFLAIGLTEAFLLLLKSGLGKGLGPAIGALAMCGAGAGLIRRRTPSERAFWAHAAVAILVAGGIALAAAR